MSLFIASLNSGSNGNCYYIGNNAEAVLIDAGISSRETVRRMNRIGLTIDKVKAIFISHEHKDHIAGVEVLARKFHIPVYITPATQQHGRVRLSQHQVIPFEAYKPVTIGGLIIQAFPKFHDAKDPHSFVVSGNGINIGVFTDIGAPCKHVIDHFKQCHAAFLEANYDEAMLEKGRYPPHLKQRISGNEGHLSNKQALELFINHKPAYMSHVLLSHLSKENNIPELAHELFTRHAGTTNVIVATRYKETEVYHINGTVKPLIIKKKRIFTPANVEQISMF